MGKSGVSCIEQLFLNSARQASIFIVCNYQQPCCKSYEKLKFSNNMTSIFLSPNASYLFYESKGYTKYELLHCTILLCYLPNILINDRHIWLISEFISQVISNISCECRLQCCIIKNFDKRQDLKKVHLISRIQISKSLSLVFLTKYNCFFANLMWEHISKEFIKL